MVQHLMSRARHPHLSTPKWVSQPRLPVGPTAMLPSSCKGACSAWGLLGELRLPLPSCSLLYHFHLLVSELLEFGLRLDQVWQRDYRNGKKISPDFITRISLGLDTRLAQVGFLHQYPLYLLARCLLISFLASSFVPHLP